MKYLLPALLLWFAACSVPPEKRVDLVLRNTTGRPIELKARTGLFGRTLTLLPGEVWYGWVPRDFVGSEITIEVKESRKKD